MHFGTIEYIFCNNVVWLVFPRNNSVWPEQKTIVWKNRGDWVIPPLRSMMFVVKTTTPKTWVSFQNFGWVFRFWVSLEWNTMVFVNTTDFEWVLSETLQFFLTPWSLNGIWRKFWKGLTLVQALGSRGDRSLLIGWFLLRLSDFSLVGNITDHGRILYQTKRWNSCLPLNYDLVLIILN